MIPPHSRPTKMSDGKWTPRYRRVQQLMSDHVMMNMEKVLRLTSRLRNTANEKVLAAWDEKKLKPLAL